jgi:hypothetical protein
MKASEYQRDQAIELLQHYFALAMGHRRAADLPLDYRTEIAEIVGRIIAAAVLTAEERQSEAIDAAVRAPEATATSPTLKDPTVPNKKDDTK